MRNVASQPDPLTTGRGTAPRRRGSGLSHGLSHGRTAFARVLASATGRTPRTAAQQSVATAHTGRATAPQPAGRRAPADVEALVADAARRYGVDPALVAGVIETESNFNPGAVSPAGAKGLMQLMDATARGLGVRDALDPAENVQAGTRLLRDLLDRYGGDTRLALAAYNAGGGAVDRYGGIPPYAETQRYVPKVLAAAARYRAAAESGQA